MYSIFALQARRLRVVRHAYRLLRFGLVGALGVVVNYTLLYLLTEACGLNHLIASALATEGAIISNFVLNNVWTFRDADLGLAWARRLWRYNLITLGGLLITVTVLAMLTYLFSIHYLVANLFAIGSATLWNYIVNARFTWKLPAETEQTLLERSDA